MVVVMVYCSVVLVGDGSFTYFFNYFFFFFFLVGNFTDDDFFPPLTSVWGAALVFRPTFHNV